jgi:hypothetical protein
LTGKEFLFMSKENNMKLDMDLQQTLMEDEHFKEGANEYERIMEQSMLISEEITSALIKEIVKKTDT